MFRDWSRRDTHLSGEHFPLKIDLSPVGKGIKRLLGVQFLVFVYFCLHVRTLITFNYLQLLCFFLPVMGLQRHGF